MIYSRDTPFWSRTLEIFVWVINSFWFIHEVTRNSQLFGICVFVCLFVVVVVVVVVVVFTSLQCLRSCI